MHGLAGAEETAKKTFHAIFDGEIAEEIDTLVGSGPVGAWDFEAVETAARRRVLAVAARAVAHRLNADHSDYVGPTLACIACQQPAQYAGRHTKTFESALAPLVLERAYYYCSPCHTGFCPRRALGMADTSLSPAVTRMVGVVGAMVSFGEGHDLLHDLAGVELDATQVERTAEALGRAIAADERHVVEPTPPAAPTMYLGLDGTGIPVRASELAGRAGKQPDGPAKTREVKLVTVWTAEGRDADGHPCRDAGSVSYSAAIGSAATPDTSHPLSSPFAQRVDREARRRGFAHAARRVVLGDGALWIWTLAEEQFPGAIQIVDLYHAKGHLSDVAKAIYGAGTDLATQWARARHAELDEGHLDGLLAALRAHSPTTPEARLCLEYVARNRRRMGYPLFRAHGLSVASGVVEAGCKVAIGTRLERAGMHWTVAGADAIIALRCCRLTGRFEDFWERRSTGRARTA